MTEPGSLRRRRRPSRRRRYVWWLVRTAVVVAVFAAGIALGEALGDNPTPGGSQTVERRLKALPLAPVRETVTVTVTAGR